MLRERLGFGPAGTGKGLSMKAVWSTPLLVVLCFWPAGEALAVHPLPDEMAQAKAWTAAAFRATSANNGHLPFSFVYDGKPAADCMKTWTFQQEVKSLDSQRTQHTLVGSDLKTGLVVRCVAIEYHDFPTVEWTLYFRNNAKVDTPILQNILALDGEFLDDRPGKIVLYHQPGSLCNRHEYQPLETVLAANVPVRISTSGGRPTNANMPYFNLARGGQGVIAVVGWPGQWAATFSRSSHGVRVQAGQERTHFKLLPGEEVRSPLMVVQFWQRDRIRSQNIWRRWMLAHNLPRPGGKLPPPLNTPCSSHQFGEMIHANEANQKYFIDRYVEEGFRPDYWWMDAGWYVNHGTWINTGTWEVDKKRFPSGLRAISDHAHAKGLKTLVWFEPERVTARSWLYQKHSQWLLKPINLPKGLEYEKPWRLLNLGNPEAWNWLTNHVDRILGEQGIDLYRQDFNMDPLYFWQSGDAADRQGITEIKHVTGYLAYWDELRRRHPNMLIDSCASGGRRNDLETLRRAVPLLRSDYLFEPIGQQSHMYGISFWIPYNGTGTDDRESLRSSKIFTAGWVPKGRAMESDSYLFRSAMSLHLTPCYDLRNRSLDYAALRRLWQQWRAVAPNYYGDYYPLTPYSLEPNVWMAWQFDRPEQGEGLVQAFRRSDSSQETAVFKLAGLDPRAMYWVTDIDLNRPQAVSGSDLRTKGLHVSLHERSAAAVITYRRAEVRGLR